MPSLEQIAFFKHNGYLIVKGRLDGQLCAEAQDRLWRDWPDGVKTSRVAYSAAFAAGQNLCG